jgi:hypothetical protein
MAGFTYKSYNFVDKDPIIDEVRTLFAQSGATYRWVEEHSGVTQQTLRNWFDGETKRPQAASINAVLRSIGFKLGVVPFEQAVAVRTLPATPQPASVRHVVQMARYKKG